MTTSSAPDAILVGGPRNGTLFTADDSAIVQLEVDGLIQRYLRTTRQEDHHGQRVVLFVYDGASDPAGPRAGLEPT